MQSLKFKNKILNLNDDFHALQGIGKSLPKSMSKYCQGKIYITDRKFMSWKMEVWALKFYFGLGYQ